MTTDAQTTGAALRAMLADGSLAGQWALEPSRSSVALRSKSMWGLMPVKGTFGQVSGAAEISAGGQVSGSVQVDAASIDTKMKKRDDHLRSADFFDSASYPHITFTAQQVTLTDQGATVAGELQVRDQTRPLSVPAPVSASADGQVQVDAEVAVDRSDFGLTWNQMGMTSMKNTLVIRAVFTRR